MKIKTISIGICIVVVIAGAACWMLRGATAPVQETHAVASFDPLNATYVIDGKPITLIHGVATSTVAPGSASVETTMVFGQPVTGDLNGDGRADAAVTLVQNNGGSGAFYYVAAAINTGTGTQGSNAILLGDRVAPQTIEIRNAQIVANYADRASGEPMTTKPSVGVSKYLALTGITLATARPIVGAGDRCGGNMMNAPVCSTGYHCAPNAGSHLPFGDVGGMCTKDIPKPVQN